MDDYDDVPADHPLTTNRILTRIDEKLKITLWLLSAIAGMIALYLLGALGFLK